MHLRSSLLAGLRSLGPRGSGGRNHLPSLPGRWVSDIGCENERRNTAGPGLPLELGRDGARDVTLQGLRPDRTSWSAQSTLR